MYNNQPLADHTPGKCSYDTPTWKRLDQERLQLPQAIHDERDPSRVKEMLASFVDVESKEDFSTQLPFRCHYVGCMA